MNYSLEKMVFWTNYYREQYNLSPVTRNPILDESSNAKILDMFANNYFEHISPSGQTPGELAETFGYVYETLGENLNRSTNWSNERAIIDQWMNSPAHRANILTADWLEIGVGVVQGLYGLQELWFAVQTFGIPKGKKLYYTGDTGIIESGNNFSILLKKKPKMTDDQYQQICRTSSSFKPYPCVVTSSPKSEVGYSILYDTKIDPVSNELTQVAKFGLKKFLGPCPKQTINIGLQHDVWEPWNGSVDNICFTNVWEVGVGSISATYYKYKLCEAPAVDNLPSCPTCRDPFWWYGVSDSSITCTDFYSAHLNTSGSEHWFLNWAFWSRQEQEVPYATDGFVIVEINIEAWFEGNLTFYDGYRYAGVALSLRDTAGNIAVVYFKADEWWIDNQIADYYSSYPQFAYQSGLGFTPAEIKDKFLIGDGFKSINIREYGLTGDLFTMSLIAETNYNNDDMASVNARTVSYNCDYISLVS